MFPRRYVAHCPRCNAETPHEEHRISRWLTIAMGIGAAVCVLLNGALMSWGAYGLILGSATLLWLDRNEPFPVERCTQCRDDWHQRAEAQAGRESAERKVLRRRARGWWIGGGLAGAALVVLVALNALNMISIVEPEPFDRQRWLSSVPELTALFHPRRQRMVDDLLTQHLHVGMPMNEVLWLVGPPDRKPYFQPGEWTYLLGQERSFPGGVDNEWLAIDFDELGCVERARLATD